MTATGLQCQRWDRNYPHDNFYKNPSLFTFASTLSDVENYCRNPDDNTLTWCYTIDLSNTARWQHCAVPVCEGKLILLGCLFVFRFLYNLNNKYRRLNDVSHPDPLYSPWTWIDIGGWGQFHNSANISETMKTIYGKCEF